MMERERERSIKDKKMETKEKERDLTAVCHQVMVDLFEATI